MARIAVVGSSNMDLIAKTTRLPRPGETVIGATFYATPGGKGANQAVAVTRLGLSSCLLARVGGDSYGRQLIAKLKDQGVDTSHVIRDEGAPSGVAIIVVDREAENMVVVASGANGHLSPEDVSLAGEMIARSEALLVQLEVPLPAVRQAVEVASRSGCKIVLNPAPAQRLPLELVRLADVLTPNAREAEAITGHDTRTLHGAKAAARETISLGAKACVVTLGAEGAIVATSNEVSHLSCYHVKVVDTTGAGDAFSGALAVGLVEGRSLLESADFASAAAALAATRIGAQSSLPRREEVERLMAQQQHERGRRS
jgi:ribokinase